MAHEKHFPLKNAKTGYAARKPSLDQSVQKLYALRINYTTNIRKIQPLQIKTYIKNIGTPSTESYV